MSQASILEAQRVAAAKAPTARLLDLLAGWSQYVSAEEGMEDTVSAEEIADLYQEAGAIQAKDTQEAEQVRQFVQQRVLPILLR